MSYKSRTCDSCGTQYTGGGYTFVEDGVSISLCYQCKVQRRKDKLSVQYKKRSGFNDIRNEIVEERGSYCEWCGKSGDVEAHHIQPLSEGGTNEKSNIVLLCHGCHRQIAHQGDTRNRG